MRARQIISGAAYDPNVLAILFQAFDEVWDMIAFRYTVHTWESARVELAEIILDLASNGTRDLEELKTSTLEMVSRIHGF